MRVIDVANVQDALPLALQLLREKGVPRETRYGPVLVMESPVTTVYRRPLERVIFYPGRDANPFFHLMEALWMLAGRNDVAWPYMFAKKMLEFSDDGETFHGAYGYRWRRHFGLGGPFGGLDQLSMIIQGLKKHPECRRQILQMWDPLVDLGRNGKDVPCNTTAHFQVNTWGALDMTVFCRSNDIIWGCYGANVVHFSILQEYMAAKIGVPVGSYWQISDNWHAYIEVLEKTDVTEMENPYATEKVAPFPLINPNHVDKWDGQLKMFMEEPDAIGNMDPFFRHVARPIYKAWEAYQEGEGSQKYGEAFKHLANCKATDWRGACDAWILRRHQRQMGNG